MARRVCANCGKEKYVEGGKVCEKGHFVCKSCVWSVAGFFKAEMRICPVCKRKLR